MIPAQSSSRSLFTRFDGNPILTTANWPYPANSVFNPGATRLEDGSTLLLCRVEDFRGHSHLTAARSLDGIREWKIDPQATLLPDPAGHPEESWGIEDPRITFLPELGQYAVVYTAYSSLGPGVSLALTKDFRNFERSGMILLPENKDTALLPRRVRGEWALIHRPLNSYGADVWISYSPDLIHWGNHQRILEARSGAWWDAQKIGLCAPPIETSEGWLVIYHGVRLPCSGCVYRLGLALFDLEAPERCLRRSDEWVFGPEAPYERLGDVGYVVFPCGTTVDSDGDTLRIYYGAADTCVALATASISEMLDWLLKHGSQ